MSNTCKNCFFILSDEQNFCSNCGQKTAVHRLSLHEIGHDVVHYFSHTDSGIFYVIKELVTAPGKLALAYIEGARKRIINPVTLLLICGTIMYFGMNLMKLDVAMGEVLAKPESFQFPTEKAKQKYIRIYSNTKKVYQFMNQYTKLLLLVFAPIIAFLYWLFFKKAVFNYAEHLVAYMFFSSMSGLISTTLLLIIVFTKIAGNTSVFLISTIIPGLYLSWAYFQLLGYTTKMQFAKAVLYTFMITLILYILIFILMGLYIFLA